jgi:DNA-binding MarR family transcriptional regulator
MKYKITFSDVANPTRRASSRDGSEYVVAESTGYLIAMLGRLFSRSLNARLQKYGISHGQWPVLLMLWAEDGLSQIEISRRIAVEPATMVRTINRMERDGLVSRQRSDVDLRQVSVFLTPYGRSLRDRIVPYATEVNELAVARMSRPEKRSLHAGLREMILALREDQALS